MIVVIHPPPPHAPTVYDTTYSNMILVIVFTLFFPSLFLSQQYIHVYIYHFHDMNIYHHLSLFSHVPVSRLSTYYSIPLTARTLIITKDEGNIVCKKINMFNCFLFYP